MSKEQTIIFSYDEICEIHSKMSNAERDNVEDIMCEVKLKNDKPISFNVYGRVLTEYCTGNIVL